MIMTLKNVSLNLQTILSHDSSSDFEIHDLMSNLKIIKFTLLDGVLSAM
jgi:hypothetical protein